MRSAAPAEEKEKGLTCRAGIYFPTVRRTILYLRMYIKRGLHEEPDVIYTIMSEGAVAARRSLYTVRLFIPV